MSENIEGSDRERTNRFLGALVAGFVFLGAVVAVIAATGSGSSDQATGLESSSAAPTTSTASAVQPSTSTTAEATTTTLPPETTTSPVPTLPPPFPRPELVKESLVASGPMIIDGQSDVVLDGLWISNPEGECLAVLNSQRVTITNSVIGPCGNQGRGVSIYLSDGVTVSGSVLFDLYQGVYALESSGVVVEGNDFVNNERNFVQFDKVGGGDLRVVGNYGANPVGAETAVDLISIFQSNGTPENPILVAHNRFRDGGLHRNGSGVMVGDNGGSHQVVENNILVNPGQVGVGVAGGSSIAVRGNLIYSDALPNSNVGIYVWDQYQSNCDAHEVVGNVVNWTSAAGDVAGFWDGDNCGVIDGVDNNDWDSVQPPYLWE